MKKIVLKGSNLLCVLLISIGFTAKSQDLPEKIKSSGIELIKSPPLGFNSYDSYLTYLNEEKAQALIDVMATKYKAFGYEYFVIDAGWYDNAEFYKGTKYPKKNLEDELDMFGLVESSKTYFPHGIKSLADRAHNKGLKFGVWIIRGIPRLAVEKNLPIKGTKYRARDIADTTSICEWSNKNYGVDMNKPGAQEFYNSLIDKLASWGVDFIKVDDMVPYPKEIIAVEKAIKNGGYKMLYSLSPGDVYSKTHLPYYKKANMVRITSDVWDDQKSIDKGFKAWEEFAGIERHNFWPDLDMIPFGRLHVMVPDLLDGVPTKDKSRQSLLTKDQMRTFITQRALAASPLFIGGDLLTMDDESYALITNRNMLACNQNGVMGVKIYHTNNIDVWLTADKDVPGKGWIGIFNRNNLKTKIKLSKSKLGFTQFINKYDLVENKNAFKVKDIWDDKEFTIDGEHEFSIPGNGVVFLKFEEIVLKTK